MANDIILAQKLLEDTNDKTIYTSPSTKTRIKTIILTNTTSSQITFNLYYARANQEYGRDRVFTNYETPISANDSHMISFDGEGYPMNVANDKLGAKCNTANALVINVSGVQ